MTENKYREMAKEIVEKRGMKVCEDNYYVVSLNFRDIQLLQDAISSALEAVARERDDYSNKCIEFYEKHEEEKPLDGDCLICDYKVLEKQLAEKKAEIKSLEERENNYLKTIGQDTAAIKGLRLEVALLEQKLEKAVDLLKTVYSCLLNGSSEVLDTCFESIEQALAEIEKEKS